MRTDNRYIFTDAIDRKKQRKTAVKGCLAAHADRGAGKTDIKIRGGYSVKETAPDSVFREVMRQNG